VASLEELVMRYAIAPFYKTNPTKDYLSYHDIFQMSLVRYCSKKNTKLYPLKRGHPCYKASFSLQKRRPYKRGTIVLNAFVMTELSVTYRRSVISPFTMVSLTRKTECWNIHFSSK
jgi:hypothetical protein